MGYDEEVMDLCDMFEAEDEGLSQGAACSRGFHRLKITDLHRKRAECSHCGELVYLDEVG